MSSHSVPNEAKEPLIPRLLNKLGGIAQWNDASKACFISLASTVGPFTFMVWYGLHYLYLQEMGVSYIAFSGSELVEAMSACLSIMIQMMLVSVVATWCVLKDRYHQQVLIFSLFSIAFTQSILFAMIGLFDGISWLLYLIYASIGMIFLKRIHVRSSLLFIMVFMILWSILYEYVPFPVRPYQFTQEINMHSMSAEDVAATWMAVIVTAMFCVFVLDILMGAWRYREEDLQSKSFIDELTGLYNRRAIQDGLKEEFFRAKRGEYPLSVAMLDLDHFKNVNDSYGHPFGDKVLKMLADKMGDVTRKKDLCGRYGGEEFLIVFPECEGEQARKILDRLRQNIKDNPMPTGYGDQVEVTLSAGIAELEALDKIEDLIGRSDKALYNAKRAGRDRVLHG